MILEVGQARSFSRPTTSDGDVAEMKASKSFLSLPYELRQCILTYALLQTGTQEIQHPVWGGLQVFHQPLFRVCRVVRDEALQAFYQNNTFLWVIDSEHKLRSDPTTYPAPTAFVHQGKYIQPEIDPVLTPALPFQYPYLMKHLRRLQVNIYLPQQRDASALREQLEALVRALEQGRRLVDFQVFITTKRRAAQIPLARPEQQALEVLAQMEVRGRVDVQTSNYFRAVSACVHGLNLKKRMKCRC